MAAARRPWRERSAWSISAAFDKCRFGTKPLELDYGRTEAKDVTLKTRDAPLR
jgi:hypothetical protein